MEQPLSKAAAQSKSHYTLIVAVTHELRLSCLTLGFQKHLLGLLSEQQMLLNSVADSPAACCCNQFLVPVPLCSNHHVMLMTHTSKWLQCLGPALPPLVGMMILHFASSILTSTHSDRVAPVVTRVARTSCCNACMCQLPTERYQRVLLQMVRPVFSLTHIHQPRGAGRASQDQELLMLHHPR